jgi:hypothetical protein
MPALTVAEGLQALRDLVAECPERASDPLVMLSPDGEYSEVHGIEDASVTIGQRRLPNAVLFT